MARAYLSEFGDNLFEVTPTEDADDGNATGVYTIPDDTLARWVEAQRVWREVQDEIREIVSKRQA
jgi:hypothetical protein